MKKNFIDLKSYFNFRMIYPEKTSLPEMNFIGCHNYFYFEENIEWGNISNSEAEMFLERNGILDCVECENQIVDIDLINANKIIIAGASQWGYFSENFKIVYDDDTFENISVNFWDWAWSSLSSINASMEDEAADFKLFAPVLKEYKRRDGQAFIYYTIANLTKSKKIKKLVFPDNICMFIFGITLETEDAKYE